MNMMKLGVDGGNNIKLTRSSPGLLNVLRHPQPGRDIGVCKEDR